MGGFAVGVAEALLDGAGKMATLTACGTVTLAEGDITQSGFRGPGGQRRSTRPLARGLTNMCMGNIPYFGNLTKNILDRL